MPRVFIPPHLREHVADQATIDVTGITVGELIEKLDAEYPGIRDQLCEAERLRPEISVWIGDSIGALGLLQSVDEGDEVHFLPTLGGG